MARQRERILLSWSGGKDSAMALHELRKQKEFDVVGLLTAVYQDDERVTMHGVGRELLEAQARALELTIEFVYVPKECNNRVYNDRMNNALAGYRDAGVVHVAYGDLYLDDIRDFREECLEAIGMDAVFPLWHRDTKELAWGFLNLKYRAVVTCVEEKSLTADYVGRTYDKQFLSDLPLGVDPCGENGEFHTFVYDGPTFLQPVPIRLGQKYGHERFHFCEVTSRAPTARPALVRMRSV